MVEILDDGRPCCTDIFLAHVKKYEEDHFDLEQRIDDWLHGAWDNALEGLPDMDFAEIEKRMFLNARQCGKSETQYEFMKYNYGIITGRFPDPTNPEEKDWARARFRRDTLSSDPSAAKRKTLRAKRKKRNKR